MARPRSSDTTNVGVYVGRVTKVTGRTCYVELPTFAPGLEYGPARYPAEHQATAETDPAGQHPDGAGGTVADHAHGLPPLAVDDAVAVAFLGGRRDEVIVLARLA